MGLYQVAEEFNGILRRLLTVMPFLFVVVFDALFILGGVICLVEYLNDWYKKVFKK